jgi:hypothetical protein
MLPKTNFVSLIDDSFSLCRIRISASDLSGLHYAIMTLVQLFTLFHPIPDDEEKGIQLSTDSLLYRPP